MKYMTKTALAVAALIAGANAHAQIVNLPGTTTGSTGSDLVLFAEDTANSTYFAQDLGVQIGSLVNLSSVTGAATTNGTFTSGLSSGVDSTLAAYLASNSSTLSSIEWTVLAANSFNGTGTAAEGPGGEEALFTSSKTLGYPNNNAVFTNGDINTFNLDSANFFANVNTNYAGANTSSAYGWGNSTDVYAKNAPESWVSATFENGAALGTAQTMYLWITNGGGAGGRSNPYLGDTISISDDTTGTITITPNAVPLPAAAWLLGSGLLGLLGIGRRRSAAAAAA